jgi:hypothetical protein
VRITSQNFESVVRTIEETNNVCKAFLNATGDGASPPVEDHGS